MAHLTLAGRSGDGKRLLLVDDRGVEYTLDDNATLRAALRGEHARIGQLEIKMDSALRPRDIQARIRAGETPEAVAQAAQTTVDRIMAFAAPVLAERAHVAQRAQSSSVRRRSGEAGARTLGEAVEVQLRASHVDPESAVEWDAWRREDGRWTLTGAYAAGSRSGTATFTYDMRGSFVTMDDDDAKWLVGEAASPRGSATSGGGRGRRLSAVPAEEELPLGEDAISLVADDAAEPAVDADPTETTMDLGRTPVAAADDTATDDTDPSLEPTPEPLADEPSRPSPSGTEAPEAAPETAPEAAPETAPETAAPQAAPEAGPGAAEDPPQEPPARKPARRRGRASVPSWDEIMFGGPSDEGRA